jgi:S-adenosylmethionine decarboxylase
MVKTKRYKSPEMGNEITCTFEIQDKNLLNNKEGKLRKLLEDALLADKFTILGWNDNKFIPEGYSCLALLKESHASFHTYPEHKTLVFEMYSCRGPSDVQNTFTYLFDKLNYPQIIFYRDNKVPVTRKAAKKLRFST